MTTPLPRRAALAGALAAVPTMAAFSLPATDPALAAIQRHRDAWHAFGETCSLTDEVVADQQGREITEADHAVHDAASLAEEQAFSDLAVSLPTTLAGLRALLAHVAWASKGQDPKAVAAMFGAIERSPVLGGQVAKGDPDGH